MTPAPASAPNRATIRLWDWPVRLCHWGFVALLPALWWTAENDQIERHVWLGIAMTGLVVLRLIWGVIGSAPARFANFVRGPAAIRAYLAGRTGPVLGHNPLGALSVVALLAALSAQVAMGLVAQDEYGLVAGPLNPLLDFDTAEWVTGLHHDAFNIILALVGLHLAAIAFYQFVRRDNLVGPMVTGRKRGAVAQPRGASIAATATAVAISGGVTAWLALGAPPL